MENIPMLQEIVQLDDKRFRLFIRQPAIQKEVARISAELSRDLADKNPVFLGILNGAFMFAGDLLRQLDFPCQISFLKMESYSGMGTTGTVRELIGINCTLEGRVVVILEDIVDTGATLEAIIRKLSGYHPAEVRVATFLHKPGATARKVRLDYVGMEIPNDFVVGYGLDYNGYGRNLREIYQLVD
jgi:hypoxanthine phosphoribosyltransferase